MLLITREYSSFSDEEPEDYRQLYRSVGWNYMASSLNLNVYTLEKNHADSLYIP